jgi:hypothetical protein
LATGGKETSNNLATALLFNPWSAYIHRIWIDVTASNDWLFRRFLLCCFLVAQRQLPGS